MRTTFLFISVLFFTACKKSSTGNNQLLPANTASTMPDISYGTDAKQKIDVYLPAYRTAHTTKVILLIHRAAGTKAIKTISRPLILT